MTLTDIRDAATGKYAITDALLLAVSDPIEQSGCLHQTMTVWDESGDHDIFARCGADMPDMVLGQELVGKGWKFRVRAILQEPIVILQGHIKGPPTKGEQNE